MIIYFFRRIRGQKMSLFKTFGNKTRTTNVVRNAGCARSRYSLKFFNELIN